MILLVAHASLCSCVLSGIFQEMAVSRKGAYSCPVASGVIFAVNVDVRGDAGAPWGAYSQALLASMQAHRPNAAWQPADTTRKCTRSMHLRQVACHVPSCQNV